MILQSKILTLLNEVLGQTAKLRKGGNEAVYFCGFCNHYKRKLNINLETGQWQCFVCHSRGSYLGSLLSKIKAPKHYRDRAFELTKDVRFQRRIDKKTPDEELSLPDDFISLAEPSNDPAYKNALFYLKKRGIGIDDICRYNIGYSPRTYKDCVIVPSYDAEGKLNYFSSRYFFQNWIKYKNAPFSKNIVGFESFINYSEPVTIVEGCFDAVSVRNNATPLFGTSIPMKLIEALVINKTPRVNLVLDNDAMKYAIKMAQNLWRWGICVHLVALPEKDPSVLGFDKVHELIEASVPLDFRELIYQRLME